MSKGPHLVISSEREVGELQSLTESLKDPCLGMSKDLSWQELWRIRQTSLEDIRCLLRKYSTITNCSFHCRCEYEQSCISIMIIRPYLNIKRSDEEFLKENLGLLLCWSCTKTILSSEQPIIEVKKLLYEGGEGMNTTACITFDSPSYRLHPEGGMMVKTYPDLSIDTDTDECDPLIGNGISTPTTSSINFEFEDINVLFKDKMAGLSHLFNHLI